MQNSTVPEIAITILVTLAGMTMGQIGMTHIFVWLYHRTNSIVLMIIFHALNNLFGLWLVSFLAEPQAVNLLIGLMPWAVVIFLQKRLGKENFPGKVNPTTI